MIRVTVAGIAGRMGQSIATLLPDFPDLTLTGGTVRPGAETPSLSIAGLAEPRVVARLEELLDETDVVIDFTRPDATMEHVRLCAGAGRAIVIGTTGLDQAQRDELREFSQQIPVFFAPNTSLGIAALHAVLPVLLDYLEGYDVEIIERHHSGKVDAPSGTALSLAEAVAGGFGVALNDAARFGRQGVMPRQPGEIGIHAVRGGGNAGEHELILSGPEEEVAISHRAFSRSAYARGALRAATFVAGREPGFYTMSDLVA